MGKNRKSKARKGKSAPFSTIEGHHIQGKTLTPPLAKIAELELRSWRDERLPEVLWAVLLTQLPRQRYLDHFRAAAARSEKLEILDGSLDHSAIAKLSDEEFEEVFGSIITDQKAKKALSPIRFFDEIPGANLWASRLDEPINEDLAALAEAVHRNSFHQSEAATDCRWLRVLAKILGGKVKFDRKFEQTVKEIFEFPNLGDMRKVRPSIRAMEGAFVGMNDVGEVQTTKWPKAFWSNCFRNTDCIAAPRTEHLATDHEKLITELVEIYRQVAVHFMDTAAGTQIDPRHDTCFGLTFYGLNLVLTLCQGGADTRAEGRLVIRTLVEVLITFSYLLSKDDETLWLQFRQYGSGQAKLAFLKLSDLDDDQLPTYVDKDELEFLANEDMWMEYSKIDLGQWAKLDLRRMSEEAGVKNIYDKYFGWPSTYVHAQWAAIRDTTFQLCLNPLHRLHRIPAAPRADMGSVAADAVRLANVVLDRLNQAYPSFKLRIKAADSNVGKKPK